MALFVVSVPTNVVVAQFCPEGMDEDKSSSEASSLDHNIVLSFPSVI